MISETQTTLFLNTYILPWGINIIIALLIFLIGKWIAKRITIVCAKLMEKAKVDVMLISFLDGILHSLLLIIVTIIALNKLGVNTTSLIAIIGAAGLAIGLALQSSLQNFAAGVMLIVFRPFKIGDMIEAGGVTGVVEKIHIFSTTMRTVDNKEIIVPNSKIFGDAITNYSGKPTRRIDLVISVSYKDDLQKVKTLLEELVNADERVLKDPALVVGVQELATSSIDFAVRPWVKSENYLQCKFDLLQRIKTRFDEEDITIPFPQMDVHHDDKTPRHPAT